MGGREYIEQNIIAYGFTSGKYKIKIYLTQRFYLIEKKSFYMVYYRLNNAKIKKQLGSFNLRKNAEKLFFDIVTNSEKVKVIYRNLFLLGCDLGVY